MTALNEAKSFAGKLRELCLKEIQKNPDSGLKLACVYGNFIRGNHIGIYSDLQFEHQVYRQIKKIIAPNRGERNSKKSKGVLHLMTTPLEAGGHTRVVERLCFEGFGEGVAFLDAIPASVSDALPRTTFRHPCLRKRSGIETINNIVSVSLHYELVILHIHPEDIYSAIAAVKLTEIGVNVYLYNHADHEFSFGHYGADHVLEISKYGWNKGRQRGIHEKQSFAGIPITTKKQISIENAGNFIGVLAGSATKFTPWREFNVVDFLNNLFCNDLVRLTGVTIYVVGPSGIESYWKELSGLARENIRFLGSIPHPDYLALLRASSFYLDSFPQGNGTGFAEAIQIGLPAFGLDLLSGSSIADSHRLSTLDELQIAVKQFLVNSNFDKVQLDYTRRQIEYFQSTKACIRRIQSLSQTGSQVALPDALSSMKCIENFWELYWLDRKKINFNFLFFDELNIKAKLSIIGIAISTLSLKHITRILIISHTIYYSKKLVSLFRRL